MAHKATKDELDYLVLDMLINAACRADDYRYRDWFAWQQAQRNIQQHEELSKCS